MNPLNRVLKQVTVEDIEETDRTFTMLMGDEVRQENILFKAMRQPQLWIFKEECVERRLNYFIM